ELPRLIDRDANSEGKRQHENRSKKRIRTQKRGATIWVLASGFLILALLGVTALITRPRAERLRERLPEPAKTAPVAAKVAPLTIEEFRVHHFRGKEAKPLGDLRDSANEIKINDSVRVFARLSAPAYCYLIAFNPDGSEQLCHPAWEEDRARQARAVRPEK